jgi:hypothetical protein
MEMIKEMEASEAIEIGLRSGHVLYGRFRGVSEGRFIVFDPDGAILFVPADEGNVAYVKLVPPDAELSAVMDKVRGGRQSPFPAGAQVRTDAVPVVLGSVPHDRSSASQAVEAARSRLESIKERYRHTGNSFREGRQDRPELLRPSYRPTIQADPDETAVQYNPTVLPDKEEE